MAGCEFAVLVAEKGCFVGQYRKVGANRKLFVCRKGWLLRIARQGLFKRKVFWFVE